MLDRTTRQKNCKSKEKKKFFRFYLNFIFKIEKAKKVVLLLQAVITEDN